MAKAEAEGANAPKPPLVQVVESADALYNDPQLSNRLTEALIQALGTDNVVKLPPIMASEDYSYFVEAGVPSFYFQLGVANPAQFKRAEASGVKLPSNHSPFFAPDIEPSLRTAVEAELVVLRNLLGKGASTGAGGQ